jgi:putative ABC transport system permease protein
MLTRLLTWRSLRARPLRILLSGFGIVLGVAAILAIGITNQTALNAVTNLFQETSGRSNLIITSNEADGKGFSENILPKLGSYPGIQSAVPSIHLTTLLVQKDTPAQLDLTFFGTDTGGMTLYGIDPLVDKDARDYKLTSGKFLPSDLNVAEVVLVEDFARENDLQVGKFMEIVASTGIEKLRIVGLIAKEGAGQLNNGSFGVIPLQTAQRLFYRDGQLDQIDLVVEPEKTGADQLEVLKNNLQAFLGRKYSAVYPASQGRRMTDMLTNYQIGLNFLSGMALFVGAFLIFNSFQMTVVERTREFGMLRTVGMTRSQVTRQVLFEAGLLGITGSFLGVGLGILLSRGLTGLMETLLGQDLANVEIPQNVVLTGLFVGIVVAILAALIPAVQAGRISPLEALRVRSLVQDGCLTRLGWIPGSILVAVSTFVLVLNPFPYDVQFRMGSMAVVLLFLGGTLLIPISVGIWEFILRPFTRVFFGRSGQIGSSNVQRSRQRTTLTVAALMIGVAMIIVVWAMTLSFKGDLDEWLKGYIGGDLYVTSSLDMGKDVWRRLEAVEGVAAATPSRYFEVEWLPPGQKAEKVMFRSVDPASYNRVTYFVFSEALPDEAGAMQTLAEGESVFISSVIAEKYNLKSGDTVILTTHLGKKPFKVAGVVVDYYNQGLVINGNWNDMWRYFRQQDANTYMVKVQEGYVPNQVADRIDDLYGKRDRLVIISNQQLLSQVSGLLDQAFRMFDILAIISMVVGFLGIANTLTMNVMERTQEIGMLRAVGMTRGQVVRMILAEAAIMGLIGGVLGVIFGVLLSRIFMQAMTAMSGYSLSYVLPLARIGIALFIAFVISQLAAFLPALRASRIRVLEAIHYE